MNDDSIKLFNDDCKLNRTNSPISRQDIFNQIMKSLKETNIQIKQRITPIISMSYENQLQQIKDELNYNNKINEKIDHDKNYTLKCKSNLSEEAKFKIFAEIRDNSHIRVEQYTEKLSELRAKINQIKEQLPLYNPRNNMNTSENEEIVNYNNGRSLAEFINSTSERSLADFLNTPTVKVSKEIPVLSSLNNLSLSSTTNITYKEPLVRNMKEFNIQTINKRYNSNRALNYPNPKATKPMKNNCNNSIKPQKINNNCKAANPNKSKSNICNQSKNTNTSINSASPTYRKIKASGLKNRSRNFEDKLNKDYKINDSSVLVITEHPSFTQIEETDEGNSSNKLNKLQNLISIISDAANSQILSNK